MKISCLKLSGLALAIGIATSGAAAETPDWWQAQAPAAIDVSAAHSGDKWLVGTDGLAYQLTAANQWRAVQGRRDLVSIDSGDDVAAAVDRDGEVHLFRNGGWLSTDITASDVAVGAGFLFLAGATLDGESGLTLRGEFTSDGELEFSVLDGSVVRIDVDSEGRIWAIDPDARVFSFESGAWTAYDNVSGARDIGVGANGTVYVVSGDGELFRRDTLGNWRELPGRMDRVTAGGDDVAVGVTADGWLLTSTAVPVIRDRLINPDVETRLADLTDEALPGGLGDAILQNVEIIAGVTTGTTVLNGMDARIALYTPNGADVPNIAIWHRAFNFVDYIPDVADTALSTMGDFDDVVFLIVPEGNLGRLPDTAAAGRLRTFLETSVLSAHETLAGVEMLGTLNLDSVPEGALVARFMQLGSNPAIEVETGLPDTVFNNVSFRDTPAEPFVPDETRTLDDLVSSYGTGLVSGITIFADAAALAGKRIGPATILAAGWEIRVGAENQIGMVLDFNLPLASTTESLTFNDVFVRYDQSTNAFLFDGALDAAEAAAAATLDGLEVNDLLFGGIYYLTPAEGELAQFDLRGAGTLASASRERRPVSLTIELEVSTDELEVTPTVMLNTALMLADLTGDEVPMSRAVELTDVVVSPDLMYGKARLNGKTVEIARFQDDSLDSPIIAFMHEELALSTYVPELADHPLAGFGFSRAVMLAHQGDSAQVFETLDDLPALLQPYLDTRFDLFPLTLAEGVSVIGVYEPPAASNPDEAAQAESRALKALGIPAGAYLAEGRLSIAALQAASFESLEGETSAETAASVFEKLDFSVSLKVPALDVPGLEDLVTFSGGEFRLAQESGELTSQVIAAMTVDFPTDQEAEPALALTMAGKLDLRATVDDIEVTLAASTAIDKTSAALASMETITDLPEPDAGAAMDPATKKLWQDALGIPGFALLHSAIEVSISADESPASLNVGWYGSGYLGDEAIVAAGGIDVARNDADAYEIVSAQLQAPGPIRIGGLPGLGKVPRLNELVLSAIDLSLDEMSGRVDWPAEQTGGAAYIAIDEAEGEPEYRLFARLEKFSLGMLATPAGAAIAGLSRVPGVPDFMWEQDLGPAVVGYQDRDRELLTLDEDTPDAFAALFTGLEASDVEKATIPLIAMGESILLAEGFTVAGLFDAADLNSEPLEQAFSTVGITEPVLITGALEQVETGGFEGRLMASTPAIRPVTEIDLLGIQPEFGESSLILSTFDQGRFGFETSADATVGQERIAMTAFLSMVPDASGNLTADDWSFEAPGPVNLGGLPGFDVLPAFNEMQLSGLTISKGELFGALDWPGQSTGGSVWLSREGSGAPELYARLNRFFPNMMLGDVPAPLGDKVVSPALVAWRPDGERIEVTRDDEMAARLTTLVAGDTESDIEHKRVDLLRVGERLTLAKGLTTAARTDVAELNAIPKISPLLALITISDPNLLLTGAFEQNSEGKFIGELSATLAEMQIDEIPASNVAFRNSRIGFDSLEENRVAIETSATVTLPLPGTTLAFPTDGTLDLFVRPDGVADRVEYALKVPERAASDYKISSDSIWKNPPMLPEVEISDFGFEGEVTFADNKHRCAFVGESSVDGEAFDIDVEVCNGQRPDIALRNPDYDPIIYIQQEIRLSSLLKGTTDLVNRPNPDPAIAADIASINTLLDYVGDAAVKHVLISRNAVSANTALEIRVPEQVEVSEADRVVDDPDADAEPSNVDDLNSMPDCSDRRLVTCIQGRSAIVKDGGQFAFFIRSENALELSALLPQDLTPLNLVGVPRGLFAISSQATASFALDDLPIDVFDALFEGLLEDRFADKLRVADGVTFLSRVNTSNLPATLGDAAGLFGLNGEFVLGGSLGGVFGGAPSISMYTKLTGVSAPLPDFAGEIIEVKDSDVEFFMRMLAVGGEAEAGFSTEATLKMPRLDSPGTRESIDTNIAVAFAVGGANAGSIEISANVKRRWTDPLGLEDVVLCDVAPAAIDSCETSVSVGVSGAGTTIGIRSPDTRFKDKNFILDLDTAWVGAAPTQLSVQFAKSPKHAGKLTIDPLVQAELIGTIFNVAVRSGSALADGVFDQLDSANLPISTGGSVALVNSREVFEQFADQLASSPDGMVSLIRNSPLALVGIENPEIFFVTPGDNLPPREGIDRPPLGLGLVAKGKLVLQTGLLSAPFAEADAEYRINLRDGYFVTGSMTPPAPLDGNSLSISGKMSLLTLTPGALRVEGSIELPGASLIPGIPAAASGWFDFTRPEFGTEARVASGIFIAGGVIKREALIEVSGTNLTINSEPKGCIDLPVKIDGTIGAGNIGSIATIASPALPIPNPLTCPESLVALWNAALDTAEEFINDPSSALDAPAAAEDAMFNASRAALDVLPDNPVTQELYAGLDFAQDTLDRIPGASAAFDQIPGSDLANQKAAEAMQYGMNAASDVANAAGAALDEIGLGGAGAVFGDAAGAMLDGLDSVAGTAGEIVSGIGGMFSESKNPCNRMIEKMRGHGTEPGGRYATSRLWEPLQAVYIASKQAEALQPIVTDTETRIESTQQPFYDMYSKWFTAAYRVAGDNRFVVEPAFKYHTNATGEGGRSGPAKIPDTYFLRTQEMNFNLGRRARTIDRKFFANGEDFKTRFAKLKAWEQRSNFAGAADNPSFRCQKQWAVKNVALAANALGHQVTFDTNLLGIYQLLQAMDFMESVAADMVAANAEVADYIKDIRQKAVERNIEFLSDLRTKMILSMEAVRADWPAYPSLQLKTSGPMEQAFLDIDRWFDYSVDLAINGTDPQKTSVAMTRLDDAIASIDQVYVGVLENQIERVNRPWASRTEQTTIMFPYADQCLRTFYRPMDNANPIWVSDCDERLQKVLNDLADGIAYRPSIGTELLQLIRTNTATGESRIVDNLSHQFWLWETDITGVFRIGTAQSEQSPLATYCLTAQFAFARRAGKAISVQSEPCIEDDPSQQWLKLADDGGPAFFRLQSVKTGQCATWNGLSGVVDSLILSDCADSNRLSETQRARQVMTAGWPIRQAKKQPVVLNRSNDRTFVFKSHESGRCFRFGQDNESGFGVTALNSNDWACGQVKRNGASLADLRFIPKQDRNDHWMFQFEEDGQTYCIVSTNTYAGYWHVRETRQRSGTRRAVDRGSCDDPRSRWIMTPSTLADQEQYPKYQIREASGQGQCMSSYDPVTESGPGGLVEHAIKLEDCIATFTRNAFSDPYSHQLFAGIQVDGNTQSPENQIFAQRRAGERSLVRTVTGSLNELNRAEEQIPLENVPVLLKAGATVIGADISDGEGLFTFTRVPTSRPTGSYPPQGQLTLTAQLANGYRSVGDIDAVLTGARNDYGLVYLRAFSIRGRVEFANQGGQSPLEDHPVSIEIAETGEVVGETLTDSDGVWEFDMLLPDRYLIDVDSEGYKILAAPDNSTTGRFTQNIDVASILGGQDVILGPDVRTISGTVGYESALSSGNIIFQGINDYPVSLFDETGSVIADTRTNSRGIFIFEDVEAGTYVIKTLNPSGVTDLKDSDGENDNAISVSVAGEDSTQHRFVKTFNGTVTGAVQQANGNNKWNGVKPLPGIEVTLVGIDPRTEDFSESATTDSNGRYAFEDVPYGSYVVSRQLPEGHRENWSFASCTRKEIRVNFNARNDTARDFTSIEQADAGRRWSMHQEQQRVCD